VTAQPHAHLRSHHLQPAGLRRVRAPPWSTRCSDYWRPAPFGSAVVVADALVWEDADESVLEAVEHIEHFDEDTSRYSPTTRIRFSRLLRSRVASRERLRTCPVSPSDSTARMGGWRARSSRALAQAESRPALHGPTSVAESRARTLAACVSCGCLAPTARRANLSGPSNWSALWLTRDRGQSKDADVRNDHVAGDRCSIKSGQYGLVDAVAGRLICPQGTTLRDGCRSGPPAITERRGSPTAIRRS
jgi:hypothetical protein